MIYEEKLAEAKRFYETANADQRYVLESLFPELKESEDEKIRKEIIAFLRSKNGYMTPDEDWDFHNKWLAWLEKQQLIDKDKLANEFLRNVALSIINWLDANTLKDKMCLSNMECEDIENAVCNADWMKIYRYMQKKLKGNLMFNVDEVTDWLDYNICNAYDYDGNDISSTLKENFIKDFKL